MTWSVEFENRDHDKWCVINFFRWSLIWDAAHSVIVFKKLPAALRDDDHAHKDDDDDNDDDDGNADLDDDDEDEVADGAEEDNNASDEDDKDDICEKGANDHNTEMNYIIMGPR